MPTLSSIAESQDLHKSISATIFLRENVPHHARDLAYLSGFRPQDIVAAIVSTSGAFFAMLRKDHLISLAS